MGRGVLLVALGASALAVPAPVHAIGKANVAALQIALRAHGYYRAPVDGVRGPKTRAALRRFQRRAGLQDDGVPGPLTMRALGKLGRPRFGSRLLVGVRVGWDVSVLQFVLARHGFPSPLDGALGERTHAAIRKYQRYAGLEVDGVAGPATLRALRQASGAPAGDSLGARAVAIAERYLGVRYVWGGANPRTGFDCSGLVTYVYGRLGISLPHFSRSQWRAGRRVVRGDLIPGDLVFFEPSRHGPGHVGIYLARGWLIEAPRAGEVVRISTITEKARALKYVGAVRPY
jgi:cell wall-associated NlpC family hydrolase